MGVESSEPLIKIQNVVKSSEVICESSTTDTITFEVVNNSEFANGDLLIDLKGFYAYYMTIIFSSIDDIDSLLVYSRIVGSMVTLDKCTVINNDNIITITMSFKASKNKETNSVICGCVVMTPDFKNVAGFPFSVQNYQCIIENTPITLANGTTKPIQDITYDDELLVWDFHNGKFASAKPNWIKIEEVTHEYNNLTFEDGRTLGLVGNGDCNDKDKSGYHRIFNKQAGAFTHTGTSETPIGTITFTDNGKELKLVKQEIINNMVKFYNLTTNKYYNCFANGVLTSCRLSNEYQIENMFYVGNRLLSDKDVEVWYEEHNPLKHIRCKGGLND